MDQTTEQLRKNYESFSDEKLIRIATEQATDLRPEALALLRQILHERGLSGDMDKGIDIQFKKISPSELDHYCEIIQTLPCPVCNSSQQKLNATMTGTVVSYILGTHYDKALKIACPDCLDTLNNRAMLTSALLGWWGIPWGIVQTVRSFIYNRNMKAQNRLAGANDLMKSVVSERIGRIEAYQNNPSELRSFIQHINNKNE